ncbi:malto-oligosyltrehalose synthase [Knoellia sp. p5-6-4]|uniref:malto-oligosyltrehalose synthase n=1 Tax=unclassified Knoellia TaxID=2618719 RepID=UPI0023DA6828|nr:malto-oligosyltrehalose synthase [Knoellia sp. p5-6-4]MDF2146209.1 malto-oligosyltrehalose synthase [Knoellia sp. p5-6-4]
MTGMPSGRVAHRPAPGRPVPSATYRLQIQPTFTFEDASAQADYLAALGVSHAYLSPVLQPAPGSTHGYDVVDHSRLNEEAGGREAYDRMVARLREHGVRAVADVVPNHMTVPSPAYLNHQWWSLLREGRDSEFAHWFDIDWEAGDGRVLMPVLGAALEEVLADGELAVEHSGGQNGDETVVRYHDHQFPVRPGTESLDLPDLLAAQAYRLAYWREGGDELNYRRFFDVTTLAAVRVEDPEVFDATHALLLELVRKGELDGLRIDHPDGLADPRGYLDRLAEATGDSWVVAEKILEGHEELPDDWRCAGTTGYDTLLRVGGVFVDPSSEGDLTALARELTGDHRALEEIIDEAKRLVVERIQTAEVNRLLRLVARVDPDLDPAASRRALEALLVAMDRYRAYIRPGERARSEQVAVVEEACDRAETTLADSDHRTLSRIRQLVLGTGAEPADRAAADDLVVRFQQTCGPVMAKAIEDTAFYRYVRLVSLNEVGGNPAHLGTGVGELHDFAERQLASWPTAMTTLSTHDTKRSEDVRARIGVISERPHEWGRWLDEARRLAKPHRQERLDAATEYLLWQTAVGAWPIDRERLQGYATKAVREAKAHTTWTDPDEGYEEAVARFVDGLASDPALARHIEAWHEETGEYTRAAVLGQKLLQLVMPGVPDVYQGTELVDLSLVDPDNRRPVDFTERRRRLEALDGGAAPADLDDDKLLVTSRALRLRRKHPEWFTGEAAAYEPLAATTPHALGVGRGDASGVQAVAVVTRLAAGLEAAGGWGAHRVSLPPGTWRDLLTGQTTSTHDSEGIPVAELLAGLPVALLVRDEY